ncbi:FkbM family methyltransferase [Bacillus sp. TL12]|uniref:FkbM family methyltransferase n=1 Tax=Bacillus sp. TL12 TaxID=2894756 RepID=UPI001F518AA2|nr:FkbM family methyltransferase [Bacillus sp. TL12]MCI0764728.1 FkbM family methyltransferase [Bacillus sp. TL12]
MSPFLPANVVYKGIPFYFATHQDDKVIGNALRLGLVIEEQILNYLNTLIKPGSHILDAGANIGSMSIILAKINPLVTIYCFEPDPLNYSLLNINIVLNDVQNIHTFNYALSKEQKFTTFYKNNINYGDHRTSKPLENDADISNFGHLPMIVPSVNIVNFLKECLGEQSPNYFDIVKIDTQGADIEILDSCLPLIKDHSTIVMEYCPYLLHRNGSSKKQIEKLLNNFSNIGVIYPSQPNIITSIDLEKIISDFDILSPTINYYDITLSRKK